MDVSKLIELYVEDVTRQLPRRMRADVGNELRALLAEELAGKSPEEATVGLRNFGRPSEVAARYHPMFTIVDPADTRAYMIVALGGAAVVSLIAAPLNNAHGQDASSISMLAWLGILTLYFGLKSWSQRRWPARSQWKPRDRAIANRFGSAALIAIALVGIVCYGAPDWLFSQITHGGKLPAVLAYTDDFRAFRLPWLLAAWGCQVLLLAVVLIEGRWRSLTRWGALSLNVAVMLILDWFRFDGAMFQNARTEAGAKSIVALAIGLVLIDTAVKIYNAPVRGGPSPGARAVLS